MGAAVGCGLCRAASMMPWRYCPAFRVRTPALLERNVTKGVTCVEDYKSLSPVGQTVLRVPTEDFAFPW